MFATCMTRSMSISMLKAHQAPYQLFPKGPLAQGCLLAGVQPPAGTQDKGFGSAV